MAGFEGDVLVLFLAAFESIRFRVYYAGYSKSQHKRVLRVLQGL